MIRPLFNYVRLTTEALSRIVCAVAITTILAGLAVWTWEDFADARRDAETRVSSAVPALDEFARRSLLAIDVVLEAVGNRVAEQGLDTLGSETETKHLSQMAGRLPDTGAVFIVGKTGDVVASTASNTSPVNLSDREWFSILRDGKAELYVGRALKGRTVHNLFFPVARSIREPNGAFIGAVQVGVEVTYIAHLFRNIDVGAGAYLGLYGARDGALVARYPMTEALLDETIETSPYFSDLANYRAQSWIGWSSASGEDDLVSARRVNGWPLIVAIGLPKAKVYSSAWTRLFLRSISAAMLIAVLLVLTALSVRQARREASLIGELEHRGKNMLTLVAAVIERAREDGKTNEEFLSSLQNRIQSMANTQALLRQSRWRGVAVEGLLRAELEPYATSTNLHLQGPVVFLAPDATHAVSMVIHELTTNAVKYGALSRPDGQVSVRWILKLDRAGAGTREIQWTEIGGPQVAMQAVPGYGSSVIRDLIPYELGGRVDLGRAADGVRCTIELPARSIVQEPADQSQ